MPSLKWVHLECDHCDYGFAKSVDQNMPYRHNMFAHFVRHHGQGLRWAVEAKDGLRRVYRKAYAKTTHEKVACDSCHVRLTSVRSLTEHWALFHRSLAKPQPSHTCDQCGRKLKRSQIAVHVQNHMALRRMRSRYFAAGVRSRLAPRTCDDCGKTLLRQDLPQHYATTHASGKLKASALLRPKYEPKHKAAFCDDCGEQLKRKEWRVWHNCSAKPRKPRKPRPRVPCPKCCRLTQASMMSIHLKSHEPKEPRPKPLHTCDSCGEKMTKGALISQHGCTRLLYSCTECPTVLPYASMLDHQRLHSLEAAACDECGRAVPRKAALYTHVCPSEAEPKVCCLECGKVKLSKNFSIHFENLHGDRKATCDDCGQVYLDVKQMSSCHNCRQDKLPCTVCSKPISRVRLGSHMRWHSTGPRASDEAVCDGCGHVFHSRLSIALSHRCPALGPRPSAPCPECGLLLPPGNLSWHRLAKHLAPVRQTEWDCDRCDAVLTSRSRMASHAARHRRDALPPPPPPLRLACDFCPLLSSSRGALFWHLCSKHDLEPSQERLFEAIERSYPHKDAERRNLTIRCDRCRTAMRFAELRRHLTEECSGPEVAIKHPEKVGCGECGKAYASRQALVEHVVFGHPEGRRFRHFVAGLTKFTTGLKALEKVRCDDCGNARKRSQLRHHFKTHRG